MAGINVDKGSLDNSCAETVLQIRNAFRKVESIQTYLSNHPVVVTEGQPNVDPLVENFGYTEDDAYLVRLVIGDLNYLHDNINTIMQNGQKLLGLQ